MANPYETRRYLDEYLLFHFGKPEALCPFPLISRDLLQFHERLRKECLLPLKPAGRGHKTRALDIGCAVGRFAFELSQVADEVIGIDYSRAFVSAARRIAKNRKATIRVHESGEKFSSQKILLSKNFRPGSVQFHVGDAMKVAADWHKSGPYNIVAGINLLCRLPSPRRFLGQLASIIEPGGQLLLASPLSWLESFTPKKEWLTPDAIVRILRPHFTLARRLDLPFVIREHRRKYQLVVSDVMTFVRT